MSWLPRANQRSSAVAIASLAGILIVVASALALRTVAAPRQPIALTVIPWDSSVLASIQIYPGLWPGVSAQDGRIAGTQPVAEQLVPVGAAYRGAFHLQPGDYTLSAAPSEKGRQQRARAVPVHVHLAKDAQIILRDCTEAGTSPIAAGPAVPYSNAAMGAGRDQNALPPPCPH